MTPTETIIEYLEGRMPLSDFYAQVLHDEALQTFLEQDASIPPYTNAGNLFLYIMDEDVSEPATDISLRDALSKLLTALGVEHQTDTSSLKTYGLALDASPAWLSLPESYIKTLIAGFETLGDKREKLAFAKDKIAKDFRYLKSRPGGSSRRPGPSTARRRWCLSGSSTPRTSHTTRRRSTSSSIHGIAASAP
ncbi:hypothetical protein [Caulobacter sp. LjRoot300]|uniref:hypothetical protein n=1 Tax=Caulobacter sp. LjRoot300 TaxID=3342321 RepID=UPI003ECFDDC5